MITQVTGQALALLSLALVGLILAKLTRIDKTLCCLGAGFMGGLLVAPLGLDTGIRAGNAQDLVFYLLLPPLLFQAAWHISPAMLRRWVVPILIFATLGVAISVAISAVLIYVGVNHSGFPWIAALLTGAILAATDPISVVNLLRTEKAPEDIATLVEGESLLNDAAAAVLFTAILSLAVSNSNEMPSLPVVGALAIHIIGGIITGIAFGLLAAILVLFLKSSVIANLILVVSAFGSFYVAQELLGLSGIITVVVTALVARSGLRSFEQRLLQDTEVTWDWLGDTFIALVFTLMGLVVVPAMFIDQWLAIVIAIASALVGRAATVYSCAPLSSLLMRHHNIPSNWKPLLVWGGLRGAIAIALVLTLPVQLPYWYTVQSMVFGVVLFNLLVQGTTCRPLVRRLSEVD
ncbi:sodium:proton antiporter [Kineobactrum sediminis]|uniref:Sodium:proton antiporter n=1 Tax=Kineobactrum sediminis TaxID=1905677 RepID=A0A2N5Y141_9GAMM|nr:cation:proton antiporter [Kineobactrum sediminis]PLW82079.1 sodium:proton antiporter [Kineobactrum sediminis]